MTKEVAKAILAYWNLQAANHQFYCPCGKTAHGVATVHLKKTEDEYNAVVTAAES